MTILENQFGSGTAPSVKPVVNQGGAPAFFSCWDIHGYYGESYIVQGVSFDIREGEIVALLGRNGAGKTSTLRCIARTNDRVDLGFVRARAHDDDKSRPVATAAGAFTVERPKETKA